MSAVYFMGAKSGNKKSDGSWYGNVTLLMKNTYGDWVCGGKQGTVWFDDRKTFEDAVKGINVGQSVKVFTVVGSREVTLALNPEYPDILVE